MNTAPGLGLRALTTRNKIGSGNMNTAPRTAGAQPEQAWTRSGLEPGIGVCAAGNLCPRPASPSATVAAGLEFEVCGCHVGCVSGLLRRAFFVSQPPRQRLICEVGFGV